jgi:hypothetical protein
MWLDGLQSTCGKDYPNKFMKASQHIGLPLESGNMTPEYAQAMLHKMNIAQNAAKVLIVFTKAHLGKSVLPSE